MVMEVVEAVERAEVILRTVLIIQALQEAEGEMDLLEAEQELFLAERAQTVAVVAVEQIIKPKMPGPEVQAVSGLLMVRAEAVQAVQTQERVATEVSMAVAAEDMAKTEIMELLVVEAPKEF